jgi:hypothetical protein
MVFTDHFDIVSEMFDFLPSGVLVPEFFEEKL